MEIGLKKDERGFFYFELYSGTRNHIQTLVWVDKDLITNFTPCRYRGVASLKERCPVCGIALLPFEEGLNIHPQEGMEAKIEFPMTGKVIRTEKGDFILRPSDEGWVALIKERSGYRGEVFLSLEGNFEVVIGGNEYHSPQGRRGKTAWALVNIRGSELVIHVSKTGRRISWEEYSSEFNYKLLPSGKIMEEKIWKENWKR